MSKPRLISQLGESPVTPLQQGSASSARVSWAARLYPHWSTITELTLHSTVCFPTVNNFFRHVNALSSVQVSQSDWNSTNSGLTEGEEAFLKSRWGGGISTRSSHIFRCCRSVGRAVQSGRITMWSQCNPFTYHFEIAVLFIVANKGFDMTMDRWNANYKTA
jgi:hypothetical protein